MSGRIVDVQAQSILLIDSLIIRDESGKEWTFNSFSQDVVGSVHRNSENTRQPDSRLPYSIMKHPKARWWLI